jgi:hypothetical protein
MTSLVTGIIEFSLRDLFKNKNRAKSGKPY